MAYSAGSVPAGARKPITQLALELELELSQHGELPLQQGELSLQQGELSLQHPLSLQTSDESSQDIGALPHG